MGLQLQSRMESSQAGGFPHTSLWPAHGKAFGLVGSTYAIVETAAHCITTTRSWRCAPVVQVLSDS